MARLPDDPFLELEAIKDAEIQRLRDRVAGLERALLDSDALVLALECEVANMERLLLLPEGLVPMLPALPASPES